MEEDSLREISFFLSPGEAAFCFVDFDAGAFVFTVGLGGFQAEAGGGLTVVGEESVDAVFNDQKKEDSSCKRQIHEHVECLIHPERHAGKESQGKNRPSQEGEDAIDTSEDDEQDCAGGKAAIGELELVE